MFFFPNEAVATHIMGGEVTWECNSTGQYIFTFKVYRDCSGNAIVPSTTAFFIHNYPSVGQRTSLSLNSALNADNEIAPRCRPGGGFTYSCAAQDPEVVFEYVRVMNPITLNGTPPAAGWIVTYDDNARNASGNLTQTGITIRAKIFPHSGSVAGQCTDNSPQFREKATSLLCSGSTFTYNHNATDDELDSLSYAWAQPLNAYSTASAYNEGSNPAILSFTNGFSFTNPFPGPEILNAATGEITLNPPSGGKFVSVVKVTAYKCGEKVAEIFRELQSIISNNCSANQTVPTINAPFQDGNGNFTLFSDTVRAGDLVTFNIQASDFASLAPPYLGDSVTLTATGLQFGANFTSTTTGCNNPPCAVLTSPLPQSGLLGVSNTFSWQTDCNHVSFTDRCISGQNTYVFVITALDDECPIPAINIATISITVVGDTVIESPTVNCADVLPNGDVTLDWDITPNINNSFTAWMVYSSTSRNGPFTILDSVKTYSQSTYTHVGANANTQQMHYVVRSRSGCRGIVQNIAKDTISTIFVNASTNPTNVSVNWNALSDPNPTGSANQYRVFREYPLGGGLGLYQSTANTSLTETFTPCTDDVKYRVDLVNSSKGCTSRSNTLDYTFKFPDPQTNFSFPSNSCPGTSINFTNLTTITGGTIAYVWDFGDGTPTSNVTSPSHAYASAGVYNVTLTATSGQGCDSILTRSITVTLPTADAGADQSICPGGSVPIGGSPTTTVGNTILWSPSTGLSSTNAANPTASPANTTIYTVTVTDVNGCTNTDQVTVTVVPFPVADAGNDQTTCLGIGVPIGGSPTGPVGATYSWSPTTGLSNATVANPVANPTTTTTYTVTVTIGSGTTCSATDQVLVTVNTLPTADAGIDKTICIGNNTTIGGSPTSTTAGVTYSWSPTSGLSNSAIANPIASPIATTTYTVVVTDGNGCTETDQVLVTVNTLPIADAGSDQRICGVGSVNIGGSPTGPIGASYQWDNPGSLSNSTIANPSANPLTTTTYTVTVTDVNGCSQTDMVTVTVDAIPSADAGADKSVCAGLGVGIGGSPTGPVGATYSWDNSGTLSGGTLANPIATPVATTVYTVTVTSTNGCTATDQVTVTVDPLPSADAGPDRIICNGVPVQIGGSPTSSTIGASYAWDNAVSLSNATTANPTANPASTTTYTVTVTSPAGCTSTDQVLVTVNSNPVANAGPDQDVCLGLSVSIGGTPTGPAGSTYQWSNAGTLDNPNSSNPNATPLVSTTYTVTVTSGVNCTAVDNVTITVLPNPDADAGVDRAICLNESVQIGGAPTSTTAGASFAWDNGGSLSNASVANPVANPTTTTTYTVTVTHPNGCTTTDQVVVTVNPLPTADAGPDLPVCNGSSIQIGGSPTGPIGATYVWDNGTSLSNTTVANPIANPIVNTTYSVTVTSTDGCTSVDQVLVTVGTLPAADAGMDQTICENASVMIGGFPTGPSGTTFQWNNSGSLDNASLANPTATPTTTTTYTVTVTDAAGCSQTDQVVVTVLPIPDADAGTDQIICNGLPVQIGGSPTSNTPGATFAWDNGATLSNTTIANPIANPSVNTTYTVTVTHPNGCTSTDQMVVTVNGLPVADAGFDVTICNGQSTAIGGSPTGPTGATYVWDNSTTLTSAIIANPVATPVAPTTYSVTVTDGNGCTNTDQVFVNVLPLATVDAGGDITICQGSSTPIGGAPTSSTLGATFAWDNASTLTNTTIANPTANPTVTTMYTVTVTHPNGCTVTDNMTVIVNPAPVTDAGIDQDLCINSSTAIGGSPTGPVGSTFAWDNGTTLTNATIGNPIANPTVTTTYTVTVTDINGCTNTDAVTITINPLPIVDAGADQTICNGDNVSIGGMPTGPVGSTFAWDNSSSLNNAAIANPVANPTTTTTYTVTVTDVNGCVNTDQVLVTVNPVPDADAGLDQTICNLGSVVIGGMPTSNVVGATFAWDNVGSLSNAAAANPIANPSTTTTYTVTVTHPNSCTSTDLVVVTVNTLPTVDAGPDVSICLNGSTPIGGAPTGPTGSTYVWDNGGSLSNTTVANPIANPIVNTTYSVTVTDGNGCTGTDQVTVTVNPLPDADAGADQTICDTESATLGGAPTSTAIGASYSWDNAGSLSSSIAANPVANPNVTTTYTVTVTDGNGCTQTDQVTITVNPLPAVDFSVGSTCINEMAQFTDLSTILSGTLQSWRWDFGDGVGTSTQQNPSYQYLSSGTFAVKLIVESALGCRDSITKNVTINSLPIVDFSFANLCLTDLTQFTDLSTIAVGNSLQSWRWDFGDGTGSSTQQSPSYTYLNAGTFAVKLVVESSFGCRDSIIKNVTINPLPTVDAGADQTICNTSSAVIGGTPTSSTLGVTYAWDNTATLSNSTVANPVANPSVTTTYTVTVTETATGCFDTDQVTVTVNPIPVVDFSFTSTCLNDLTQFTDLSSISVGTINSWRWDFGDGVGTSIQQNPSYQFLTSGTFAVKLITESVLGCKDSITKNVVINPLPIVDAGLDRTICNTFTATLGGAPTSPSVGATYAWAPAASLNDAFDSNPTASPSTTTTYTVTVTDVNGCTNTDQVTISVNPLPTVDFTSTQVCLNEMTQFTDASSIALPSILQDWEWDFGDGVGTSTQQNPQYTYAVAGSYDVKLIVTSSLGCIDSITKMVVVDTLPLADAGADRTICELDTTQLGKPTVMGETYQWDNVATLSNATIAEPRAFPIVSTTYSVTVTNSNGCTNIDQVIITVNPAPNVDAGPDLTTCNKDTIVIGGTPTSTTAGVTYLWNNATSLDDATLANPKAFPSDTTIYIVTVTDANGCTSNDTMQLNINPLATIDFQVDAVCEKDFAAFTDLSTISAGSIVSWNWSFGDGIGTSILQNPGYLYASPGDYDVRLTVTSNEGCVDSIIKTVSILALPIADAGGDKEICFGDTVTLGGSPTGSAGSTYSWAPGFDLSSVIEANPKSYPLSSTIYYLTVTGANGCFSYDTAEVTVNALPIVTAEKDSSLCVDQPVQLNANGASVYSWSPSIYLDDPTVFNPVARAFKNTTYVVRGTDLNGCIDTDTVEIKVFNVDFTAPNTSICSGDSVELMPIVQGDTVGGVTYSWTPTFPNLGLSNPNIMNPKASPNIDRFYVLEITNAKGCVDKDSIEVKLNQAAGVDFEFLNSPRCSGAVIEIVNTSTSTDNFVWELNGIPVSEERDPEIGINNLTENRLTLIGSNSTCTDSISKIIPAEGLRSLLKLKDANVFTPNGDGINDIFDPGFEGEFIGCVNFQIFDRWGDKVFDSNIGQYGWDGRTLRGRNAPTGIYYYVILIANEEIRGSVYLNR